MEEREALKRQIELLQNLINNHKNIHGDTPSSSTHQWYAERPVVASGRGQSTSFVHPHSSRGSSASYGPQSRGHWRKTYSLSNKTSRSSTAQPSASATSSVPLPGTLKEASHTSTLPSHSSKAPGRGQPGGTKIAVSSSGIPPGDGERQKNAITGIGLIAPRTASTGICTTLCKGTPESVHNRGHAGSGLKGALQKDHQRQTADPQQRAEERKDRGSVDVTSSVKTDASGQTHSSTQVEIKAHLPRKPTEVKPTVHVTAPDTLTVGKSKPALSALPSAPQQQLSLSPRSKPSPAQLAPSPQKRFTWVRSQLATEGEVSPQSSSPLQSPEKGLSPALTSISNASQATGRSPPTTVGKRTPSKKLPRRLSQATGAPKTSKYTWISSSSTVGSQAKLFRKTPSPRSVSLPQRALEKGVSGSKLRNPSPALTPKARKGMGPSSAGSSLSSRYRWKAVGQSTAGTAAGGAAARRGSTFHWTSEKSYKAAKGWLAVPPSLPQSAALQSSSPSASFPVGFKLRSRMKIIRRSPNSGSLLERKTTVGSPVGMMSGRHSFRGRAQPLIKSPTGGRSPPSKELVSFGRHKLRRLSPASCRTGPSSPVQRGPAYQRVFRSRYKMVTRQGSAASAHTFHYSPALTWRAKRIQSARCVLQNRLRAPQDRHLSPQRWRGRGIRWIGGSLYRVSANKLSRAAASSLPINRTGKWSSPHQVSPTTSPLGRPSSTRHVASRAVQRSLAIIRHARHKKPQEKQYCMYYNRFGKCNRGTNCPYIHDPDKVAVCTRFLRGTCKQADGTCPFSHKVAKEKMPVCSYFLKGICNNSNCPYSHVYVSRNAAVCQDFIKGYCPQGEKTKNGTQIMQGLTHQSCVRELKRKVEELTGIPCDVQRIMVGYPPSSLDLRNGDARLKDYPIKSGDTLIVEEEKNKPKIQDNSTLTKAPQIEVVPVLVRRVVPADNSCLFTSINYVAEGGVYDPACAPQMRGLIARIVASDPAAYSEAVLGKTNAEYCAWIQRSDTWGGAIEVSILSKFYRCEICVVDTQTVRVDRFGENAGYGKRVLLIYDGIHYDPLQKEMLGLDVPPQTIFSTVDDVILALALELADEAQSRRQFTDVNRFALRCLVCQTGLVGQKEARDHAKETGHTNFGECKKKHTLVCPDFSRTGSCPQGARCKLQHRQRAKRQASTPGPSATTSNPAKKPRPKEHAKRPRLSVNIPLPEQAQQDAGDSLKTPTSGLLKLPSFISLCSSPEEAEVPDTPPPGTPHIKERKLQIKPRL